MAKVLYLYIICMSLIGVHFKTSSAYADITRRIIPWLALRIVIHVLTFPITVAWYIKLTIRDNFIKEEDEDV